MKIIFGNPTAEMILEAQRNEDGANVYPVPRFSQRRQRALVESSVQSIL